MSRWPTGDRAVTLADRWGSLHAAARELLNQEFSYSTGHLTVILNSCLFAPSMLTFWFVNGIVDFSSAIAIGAVATRAGLQVRLLAYLLVVPTFLLSRATAHMLHPGHRAQLLAGTCPQVRLMSLDWFSMGILTTGLPLALQNFGPWFGMNAVFLVGVFLAPLALPDRRVPAVKLAAIVSGLGVFLYASYGSALPVVAHPSTVLGPIATFALTDETTKWLFRLVNSVAVGPLVVGAFAVAMNHVLTHPQLTDVPVVRRSLPRRDPDAVVVTSAAFGTAFYLVVVAVATGQLVVIP
jgi:hypothetical protein